MKEDKNRHPGWRILVAGAGGQGVLTVARILCELFVKNNHQVISGQLHGMSQRGGTVQSSVMVDSGISPMIPLGGADFVLGFEPLETVRCLPYLSKNTIVLMNQIPVITHTLVQQVVLKKGDGKYPASDFLVGHIRAITPHCHVFDARQLALAAGSEKTMNIVMLGALLGLNRLPCTGDDLLRIIEENLPEKLVELNQQAIIRGLEQGRQFCGDS